MEHLNLIIVLLHLLGNQYYSNNAIKLAWRYMERWRPTDATSICASDGGFCLEDKITGGMELCPWRPMGGDKAPWTLLNSVLLFSPLPEGLRVEALRALKSRGILPSDSGPDQGLFI